MSEPEQIERKTNQKTSGSDDKDSRKIWVTLPVEYAEILDILAGDAPDRARSNRKSVIIEKMVDDYLEKHEKTLRDDGKWDLIIEVRRSIARTLDNRIRKVEDKPRTMDDKLKFLEGYTNIVTNHKDRFNIAKLLGDDKVEELYAELFQEAQSQYKSKPSAK